MELEAKDIILIATAVITASVTVFNWRASRYRGKLKDDLEIQKKYREELQSIGKSAVEISADKYYMLLQAKIIRKMEKAYLLRGADWSDAAISVFFLFFTVYALLLDDNSRIPQALQPTVIVISAVLFGIYAFFAIRHKGQPRE